MTRFSYRSTTFLFILATNFTLVAFVKQNLVYSTQGTTNTIRLQTPSHHSTSYERNCSAEETQYPTNMSINIEYTFQVESIEDLQNSVEISDEDEHTHENVSDSLSASICPCLLFTFACILTYDL